MDSGVVHSRDHEYNEQHHPHNVDSQQVAHGAENQDHEKKSVLTKVKEKARKIKDTIKKHGYHNHDHEYRHEDQHIPDDHDLDEEDDEQEVMAEGPEVHGAPIYDSAAVKSTIPGQVENLGQPTVNVGSTTVTEEESHHEPRTVVVSPTAESDQNRATEADRTFVGQEEKSGQPMVNLERPMGLEDPPDAPGSRPEVHTPFNYQTKVTDPTGAGTGEIDTAPIEKSFARMGVQDEAEAKPEPKVLPTAAETQDPSTRSHDQFLSEMPTETKTQHPSAGSHDQFAPDLPPTIPNTFSENLQAEPKVLSSAAADTQHPSLRMQDHFLPKMSTANKTEYPSVGSHEQFAPEPSPTNPNKFPENLQEEPKVLPVGADCRHPSVETHGQYPSVGKYDQFAPEPIPTISNKFPENLQAEPKLMSTVDTQHPSAGSHDQFLPEVYTPNETQYPSAGIHDQFASEPIPTYPSKFEENPQATGQFLNNTTRTVEQPHFESTEQPSDQSSYTEKVSSAIPDKSISAKNVVASKLGYDEKGDRDENETGHEEYRNGEKQSNQSSYTEKISSAPSAIVDKAVSSKNAEASELGYDEKGDRDEHETKQEEYRSGEKLSNQSSYAGMISSTTSAIADKAVSAKNAVASKLGYDEKDDRDENETRHEEYGSAEKPASKLGYDEKDENEIRHEEHGRWEKPSNQSNYTEKISSATSAISDKAVSDKNVEASKVGYGDKGDMNDKETTSELHKSGDAPTMTGSSAEYGKEIARSPTEELAPYGNVAGAGSAAMLKVPGTETETETSATKGTTNETESGVPVQDKGVSVKDYMAEKLRPGDEDRALSELISDTLHKRKEEPAKTLADEDRTVTEVISEATHKQEEEPEKAKHHLGKVTEPEEVKTRLGTEYEKSDKGLEESCVNSPNKGMVGKLKDVVGSWFGKPGDNQSSQGDEGLSKNNDGEAGRVDRVEEKSSN